MNGAIAILVFGFLAAPLAIALELRPKRPRLAAAPAVNPFADWGPKPKAPAPIGVAAGAPAPSKAPLARDGSVADWRDERIVARPGFKVRGGALYEDYAAWCALQGETPVSSTKWGLLAKGPLGLRGERLHNRVTYYDICLAQACSAKTPQQESPPITATVASDRRRREGVGGKAENQEAGAVFPASLAA